MIKKIILNTFKNQPRCLLTFSKVVTEMNAAIFNHEVWLIRDETIIVGLCVLLLCSYYAVVHPINAKIFNSKRRTIKIIASTWLIAAVCALPYLYCKSYAFSISSSLGSVSRYICTDRFDDIDQWMYGESADNGMRNSFVETQQYTLLLTRFDPLFPFGIIRFKRIF